MSEFQPPPQYAQYPRNSFQPSGEFDRPPGVYFDAVGDAWTLVKRDLGTWVALLLVAIVIASLIALPFQSIGIVMQGGLQPTPGDTNIGAMIIANVLSFIGSAMGFPVYAGLLYAALKQIRGESISISDLFKGFSHFVPLALFGVLYHVLVLIACLLCLFPGVFAIGVLAPGMLLIMDRGYGPVQALTEGMRTLGNQAWMLGLFLIVVYVAMSMLGTLMCCIGLLVTLPIVVVSMALHYNYFWPTQTQQVVMPDMTV